MRASKQNIVALEQLLKQKLIEDEGKHIFPPPKKVDHKRATEWRPT